MNQNLVTEMSIREYCRPRPGGVSAYAYQAFDEAFKAGVYWPIRAHIDFYMAYCIYGTSVTRIMPMEGVLFLLSILNRSFQGTHQMEKVILDEYSAQLSEMNSSGALFRTDRQFLKCLHEIRRKIGIPRYSGPRISPEVFERNLVVYTLSELGFGVPEIEKELQRWGGMSFPANEDAKAFVRRTRQIIAKYRRIVVSFDEWYFQRNMGVCFTWMSPDPTVLVSGRIVTMDERLGALEKMTPERGAAWQLAHAKSILTSMEEQFGYSVQCFGPAFKWQDF